MWRTGEGGDDPRSWIGKAVSLAKKEARGGWLPMIKRKLNGNGTDGWVRPQYELNEEIMDTEKSHVIKK